MFAWFLCGGGSAWWSPWLAWGFLFLTEFMYVILWAMGHEKDFPRGASEWKGSQDFAAELLQVVGEFLIAFVAGLCEYIDCWISVQILFCG